VVGLRPAHLAAHLVGSESSPAPMTAPSRSAALLERARTTPGFMPEGEGLALAEVAHRAGAGGLGPLVELGAYRGRSTLFLAAGLVAALEGGAPAGLCFSVDHHRGSEEMQAGWEHHDPSLTDARTGRMDSLPEWRRNVEEAGVEGLVVGLIGDSPAIAAAWGTPLSLVFVDGGHGRGPAWADYRGWAPHVAPGGFLAFHDVFPDPADGGRPPYECYLDALASGAFEEDAPAGRGSLRVLRRRRPPSPPGREIG